MSTTQEARRVIARSLLQLSLALGAALALAGPPFMTLTGPLPEDFVNVPILPAAGFRP